MVQRKQTGFVEEAAAMLDQTFDACLWKTVTAVTFPNARGKGQHQLCSCPSIDTGRDAPILVSAGAQSFPFSFFGVLGLGAGGISPHSDPGKQVKSWKMGRKISGWRGECLKKISPCIHPALTGPPQNLGVKTLPLNHGEAATPARILAPGAVHDFLQGL